MQHRVGFVIDCQTSRTKVNLRYLELVQKLICDIGLTKWSLVIVLGPRPPSCRLVAFKSSKVALLSHCSGSEQIEVRVAICYAYSMQSIVQVRACERRANDGRCCPDSTDTARI